MLHPQEHPINSCTLRLEALPCSHTFNGLQIKNVTKERLHLDWMCSCHYSSNNTVSQPSIYGVYTMPGILRALRDDSQYLGRWTQDICKHFILLYKELGHPWILISGNVPLVDIWFGNMYPLVLGICWGKKKKRKKLKGFRVWLAKEYTHL